ncbi:hypothetical protein KA405_03225 [Patescibacteria group bacterium]|nr:hypothetical protein [Patescibacteria group bacterium]
MITAVASLLVDVVTFFDEHHDKATNAISNTPTKKIVRFMIYEKIKHKLCSRHTLIYKNCKRIRMKIYQFLSKKNRSLSHHQTPKKESCTNEYSRKEWWLPPLLFFSF